MSDRTPEENKREGVEATDWVAWLAEVRGRVEANYEIDPLGRIARERQDARALLYYVDTLRDYLREKNEIIRAYAGPTGMTPEDVADALDRFDKLQRVLAAMPPDEP